MTESSMIMLRILRRLKESLTRLMRTRWRQSLSDRRHNMDYNRTMRAMAQEDRIMRRAERDGVTMLVLLMNEYHALRHRYFPSEELRKKAMAEKASNVKSASKAPGVPQHIRTRVNYWINHADAWHDAVETLHIS